MEENLITREGLVRLSAELEQLRTEGRRQIAERLKRAAASEANREENVDYLGVREDQAAGSRCSRSGCARHRCHRQNILDKLGMSDRVELTRYAIRRGLIQA